MAARRRRALPRPQATPTERRALLELQGGRCGVCGRADAPLVTGHSYRPGKTRGLLCRQCNCGLGMLGDSPTRLRAALEYLLRSPTRLLGVSA